LEHRPVFQSCSKIIKKSLNPKMNRVSTVVIQHSSHLKFEAMNIGLGLA
jgi:hypothetical protein